MGKAIDAYQYNSIVFNVSDDIEEWKMRMSEKYGNNDDYQTVIGRGFIHIYKIAMIFTMYDENFLNNIIDKSPTFEKPVRIDLPKKWVDESIKIYELYLFPRMIMALNMSKVEDKTNRQVQLLEKLKELEGTATHSQLMRATAFNSTEMKNAMDALIQSGQVFPATKRGVGADGKLSSGPKRTVYCLVAEEHVEEMGNKMDGKSPLKDGQFYH
jgi:hypothetical protein